VTTDTPKVVPATAFGRRFRSTTEARWAVFLTVLGVAWEYEPETYDLGLLGWYLPDFWLPGVGGSYEDVISPGVFLEVKRTGDPSPEEIDKAKALATLTGHRVAIAKGFGVPAIERGYGAIVRYGDPGELVVYRRGGIASGRSFTKCECGRVELEWDVHDCSSSEPGYHGPMHDLVAMRHAYDAGAAYRPDER
jgi:hypothetical protein